MTMNHQRLIGKFPFDRYPSMTDNQSEALSFIAGSSADIKVIEAPTGTGKTAIGYAYLKAQMPTDDALMYLAPNKTLVDEVCRQHPDVKPVYGRNEHDCLYYTDETFRADQVACSLLVDCPHRVDQETGATHTAGATPCPYLAQKYRARSEGGIIAATFAFYLYAVFFGKQFTPKAVVLDEAHGLAKAIRSVLEFRISDWKLATTITALENINSSEAGRVERFRDTLVRLAKKRTPGTKDADSVLSFREIRGLLGILADIDQKALKQDIRKAVSQGLLSRTTDREALKQLEVINGSLKRYINSFKYSLPPEDDEESLRRHPLNYTFAYWVREKDPQGKVQHELVVKSYGVAGLIKAMLPEQVLAYSATIADAETFSWENGIEGDFKALGSNFPNDRTRIFMPTDTANLAVKNLSKGTKTKTTRAVVRVAKKFADRGVRSLIVVVSNQEREKFLMLAKEEGLDLVSYGEGVSPRQAVAQFKDGRGMALVGTVSNYGEGVDLPKGIAPVIFFFRPSYPHPDDPQTVYEENRFKNHRWNLWNWRVMVEMLQVRGRNVRSIEDVGVTFLVSQQFRRFARASLPLWLRPAYVGDKTLDECVDEAMKML